MTATNAQPTTIAAPTGALPVPERSAPRRADAAMRGRCADGLREVPAEAWDALIEPGAVPLKHRFLTAWECSELPGLRSRPVLAHVDGRAEPIGACPGYFYDLDIASVSSPALADLLAPIRRLWRRLLVFRSYELGSPTPLVKPFLAAEPGLRRSVVPALLDAAIAEARHGGADFMLVQNFITCRGPAADALADRGFAAVPGPPAAVVSLPYSSFDEYLGAMRAQYRRRAQQTLKRTDSLRVEHLDDFAHLADELARLWRSIYDRAREIKREILTPAFFRGVSDVSEASVLLTRRPDDTIASFALLVADEPWLSFVQCGFEEEAGRGEGAYFRLLYEIIRYGIDRGFEQVDLGITTLTPKLDVGAVPVPLYAWIRHANPVLQRAIRLIARSSLVHRPDVAARRVFKEDPPSAEAIVAARRLPS